MEDTQVEEIVSQAKELAASAESAEKRIKLLVKTLKQLADEPLDLGRLRTRLSSLQDADGSLAALESSCRSYAGLCNTWAEREEKRLPLVFGRELKEECERHSLHCEVLGQSPPSFRIGLYVAEVSFAKSKVSLELARQSVATCGLNASEIVAVCLNSSTKLDTPFDGSDFVEKLFRAYRRRLEMTQAQPGERVDLADVWPELSLLMQAPDFYRDPTPQRFREYTRLQFSYDLMRLRKSAKLEFKGFRLTLGTATVGSTKDKSRVFFLEEGGRGQYYLTLSFQGNR